MTKCIDIGCCSNNQKTLVIVLCSSLLYPVQSDSLVSFFHIQTNSVLVWIEDSSELIPTPTGQTDNLNAEIDIPYYNSNFQYW